MISLESLEDLEKKGVFINCSPEHYKNGSNLCFSIEFVIDRSSLGAKKTDKYGNEIPSTIKTGWYNDNHDFGNACQSMLAAIKLAFWYLEKPDRIFLINSGYHDPEYADYVLEKRRFLDTIKNFDSFQF